MVKVYGSLWFVGEKHQRGEKAQKLIANFCALT